MRGFRIGNKLKAAAIYEHLKSTKNIILAAACRIIWRIRYLDERRSCSLGGAVWVDCTNLPILMERTIGFVQEQSPLGKSTRRRPSHMEGVAVLRAGKELPTGT